MNKCISDTRKVILQVVDSTTAFYTDYCTAALHTFRTRSAK